MKGVYPDNNVVTHFFFCFKQKEKRGRIDEKKNAVHCTLN